MLPTSSVSRGAFTVPTDVLTETVDAHVVGQRVVVVTAVVAVASLREHATEQLRVADIECVWIPVITRYDLVQAPTRHTPIVSAGVFVVAVVSIGARADHLALLAFDVAVLAIATTLVAGALDVVVSAPVRWWQNSSVHGFPLSQTRALGEVAASADTHLYPVADVDVMGAVCIDLAVDRGVDTVSALVADEPIVWIFVDTPLVRVTHSESGGRHRVAGVRGDEGVSAAGVGRRRGADVDVLVGG